DALFLTDHNEGSDFQIDGATANRRTLDEDSDGWKLRQRGTLAAPIARLEGERAYRGSRSYHLAAAPGSNGTLTLWTPRGPLVAAGPVRLRFALLVRQLEPGTGFVVALSLGGDSELGHVVGYTNERGDVLLERSVTFAWTIGQPSLPASSSRHQLVVLPLPEPPREAWATYTLDVSEAVERLPAEQRPHRFAAFLYPRFTLTTSGGGAEIFLDSVELRAERPLEPAQEFVARTELCRAWSDPSFLLVCAHEMGQQRHTIRFDFAIDDPAQFRQFTFGTDGIPLVHEAGFPAQLDHPGSTIRIREILDNRAYDADFLEVRKPEWTTVWDELLVRGVHILGAWGTDSHEVIDSGNPATYVFARGLTREELVRALYEGRSFLARNTFTGAVIIGIQPSPDEPYPARYPIFVSDRATSVPVFLRVTAGLPSGSRIRWIRNGRPFVDRPLTGPASEDTLDLPLAGPLTVVRAEIVDASGRPLALTQPLVFRTVPGSPAGTRIATHGIETMDGTGYNRHFTLGITDAEWDASARALLLTLRAPAGARVELLFASDPIGSLELAGSSLPVPGHLPHLAFVQPASVADLVVSFAPSPPRRVRPAPAPPSDLAVVDVTTRSIELRWSASSTHDRPLRYLLLRDGSPLAWLGAATAYVDRSVEPGRRYRYAVVAVDLTSGRSRPSTAVAVDVPPPIWLADDFETGSLGHWTVAGSVDIQERSGHPNNRAVRLDLAGSGATLERPLSLPYLAVSLRFRFLLLDQGSDRIAIASVLDREGRALARVTITGKGTLVLDDGERSTTSAGAIAFGTWYACELRLLGDRPRRLTCTPDDASVETLRAELPPPSAGSDVALLRFGQLGASSRAVFLLDDVQLRLPESPRDASVRPQSWGVARGRR
ncbi:MAG: hypothetical protein N2Z82_00640, partial [Thermomicrobium sp.]|nr:hypothetical protein [Thermomicrobium sp.]